MVTNFTIQMLNQKIRGLPYIGSNTATGDALREARNICDKTCRPFHEGAARSVVVLTDGHSNEGSPVKPEADALAHITKANIFAVGIGTGINKAELDMIASKPQYVLQLADYKQLTHVINNITLRACDMPVFVMPNVKVESEVSAKNYRYYQLDTSLSMGRSNGQGIFITVDTVIRKGHTRVFTSTTDTNPHEGTGREIQDPLSRSDYEQSYMEYVEPNTPTFYFSILGVDPTNQYELVTRIFDLNGISIG